ncbi:MAG: PilZ domain-containing protein [Proteobacteria bacterium]|nr:PilZ domain-containing protein [Pseudomonadota bacterium]NOG59011.1 PilZ domain-containing protein [Pseudomonadota bacterium]
MNLQATIPEKRQFSRIAFDAPATLKNGNNQWKSKLLDVSLKGALVSVPENWNSDNEGEYKLSIFLDTSDVEIVMNVSLVHTGENHLGFRCEHIDLDSVTYLKRLVELNLGDEEILDREISHMLTK